MFEVIVGNIGRVYEGTNEGEARSEFRSWVLISQGRVGYSRAAGEPVTLMGDGEILDEYSPADIEPITPSEERAAVRGDELAERRIERFNRFSK